MNDLKTYTGDNLDDFASWLLSVEKVAKLTDNYPKDICFAKAEDSLLKFLYLLPLKNFFLVLPQRKNKSWVLQSSNCKSWK